MVIASLRVAARSLIIQKEGRADSRDGREGHDQCHELARTSHLCYTLHAAALCQTRVKLNRVFFPRWNTQARSLGGWITSQHLGTAGISLIHSCA